MILASRRQWTNVAVMNLLLCAFELMSTLDQNLEIAIAPEAVNKDV